MLDIGMPELIVIFIVALLVFGPKRLPELGKSLGKGIAELKKAMRDVKEQMDSEINRIEHSASVENPDDKKENKGDTADELKSAEKSEEKKNQP